VLTTELTTPSDPPIKLLIYKDCYRLLGLPIQQAFPWLVIAAVGGTLIVLIMGVISMLRHGKADARTSNKLMRYRILFQFAAVALVAMAFIFGDRF
jgi:amino acid transporter